MLSRVEKYIHFPSVNAKKALRKPTLKQLIDLVGNGEISFRTFARCAPHLKARAPFLK